MPEAARCPQCHWGRLTYPLDIDEQQCIGCRGEQNRQKVNTGLGPMWPLREVYRSGMNEYGQEGVYDDD